MSATVRGVAYGVSAASAASANIPETAGSPQAGDTRFIFMLNSPTATITTPAGWTPLFNGNTTSTRTYGVFSRPWVAGVGNQVVSFSTGVVAMQIIAVAGLDPAATPQLSVNGGTTTGTTATATGMTPTTADQLAVIHAGWIYNSPNTGADTATFTSPSGATQVLATRPTGSTTGYDGVLSSRPVTSTAATGTFTTTTNTTATAWISALLLIPSVASATPTAGNFLPYLGLGGGVSR